MCEAVDPKTHRFSSATLQTTTKRVRNPAQLQGQLEQTTEYGILGWGRMTNGRTLSPGRCKIDSVSLIRVLWEMSLRGIHNRFRASLPLRHSPQFTQSRAPALLSQDRAPDFIFLEGVTAENLFWGWQEVSLLAATGDDTSRCDWEWVITSVRPLLNKTCAHKASFYLIDTFL